MPSKTKRQVIKAKRINGRGGTDLSNGHVNARAVRFGISIGTFKMQRGMPPEPPPEWRDWKRERFWSSIKAAHLFLKGKELNEVALLVGKGRVGVDVTRQRISQMVAEGVQFFLDRRFVESV